jgi:hypothetical protein
MGDRADVCPGSEQFRQWSLRGTVIEFPQNSSDCINHVMHKILLTTLALSEGVLK